MTTEALLSRQLLGWPRDFPPLVKGVGMVSAHLQEAEERNIYYWYYATQLLHNMKGERWELWNLKIREGLIGMQVKDGTCAQGSWDPFQPQPDILFHGAPWKQRRVLKHEGNGFPGVLWLHPVHADRPSGRDAQSGDQFEDR